MKQTSIHSGVIMLLLMAAVLFTGCYSMRASKGGGQIKHTAERKINHKDILLTPGYKIEAIAEGLTFPTDITFDQDGNAYVVESGYAYGEVWTEPKLIRLDQTKTVIAKGEKNGPWNGLVYYNGNFYVSEGGELEGGKILRISPKGETKVLVDNLPSTGDHHTNQLIIQHDYIYFGQGTATNSGVVGQDNADFGWLKRNKDFHDIPCQDIKLTGENYTSPNVLTEDDNDEISTGAFVPFGKSTSPGEVIKGSLPCNGAIMRIPVNGGDVELVSWGLRNPFGLALAPDGRIYTTENAYDERGSRPVWGTGDVLWEVKKDQWYGWPDLSAGQLITHDEEFTSPSSKSVKPVLQVYPQNPPEPVAVFGVHASACGLAFSTSSSFGFEGDAFVAQFGDMAPDAGKVLSPVGFKIVRVNVTDGVIRDFAVNKGKRNGPASWLKNGGLERPVSVKFAPDGKSLYVVDFGVLRMDEKGAKPQKNTGIIWKITKDGL